MNTHRAASARVTVPAPVRRWLYGIAAAAAPLATVYGLVTEQQAVLWLNLAGAVQPQDGLLRSEEHTSELQSRGHLVCRLLLEKTKQHQPPARAPRRTCHNSESSISHN